MALREKEEALRPFLESHEDDDSRDGSVELRELKHDHDGDDSHDDDVSAPLGSESDLSGDDHDGTPFFQESPQKKPATYAIALMLAAQVFSASMNVSIRLLENASTHLHPLQILFVRMSVTTLGITLWLWRQNKPKNILGRRENRLLLIVRAFGGFLGVFGLYCMSPVLPEGGTPADLVPADSLRYLNLSEATVITFMMPLVASLGGYLLLGSPFSWLEILLSIISLFGVLLVASPDALFPAGDTSTSTAADDPNVVELASRIWALCVGLLGVCGSAAAFLCMSAIGKTENPLTVVNYFAAMCTVVSCVALIMLPGLGFQAPGNIWEWLLLFFSGLSGFLMVSPLMFFPSPHLADA